MIKADDTYKAILQSALYLGMDKPDRTGTGTRSTFGCTFIHHMEHGFPLLTTKYVSFKCAKTELLWILNGFTDIKYLNDNGVKYWNADYKRSGRTDGTLGKIYGYQWRNFNGIDQILNLVKEIKSNPSSRRLLVSAWNPSDMDDMALPPCHDSFQIYINNGNMDLLWRQRSVDIFLGLPYDIAMYGMLLEILAKSTGYRPNRIVGHFGDCHLYNNHIKQAYTQLDRIALPLPVLKIKKGIAITEDGKNLIMPELNDLKIENYEHHPAIKAELST
jgi:thymidylate synthase